MSTSLDPDQAQLCVGPDLGTNYLQRLSADDTSRQRVNLNKTSNYKTESQVDIINPKMDIISFSSIKRKFLDL